MCVINVINIKHNYGSSRLRGSIGLTQPKSLRSDPSNRFWLCGESPFHFIALPGKPHTTQPPGYIQYSASHFPRYATVQLLQNCTEPASAFAADTPHCTTLPTPASLHNNALFGISLQFPILHNPALQCTAALPHNPAPNCSLCSSSPTQEVHRGRKLMR